MLRPPVLSVALAFLIAVPVFAQQSPGGSYPTVYGSTGRPYGPTQAEYQYQLQYGHPSPGNTGGGLGYVNGYPGTGGGGYGGHWGGGVNPYLFLNFDPMSSWYPSQGYVYYPSTAYYGSYYNYNSGLGGMGGPFGPSLPPLMTAPTPPLIQGNALPPNVIANGLQGAGITQFPTITNPPPIVEPSTPQAQESSQQYQTQGDLQLQQLNYYAASERYKKAIDAARDRADPRYRLAVTLAARSRFLEAVDQLKLAVAIDPTWPQHADSLDQVFRAENTFEKTRVKQRVAEWTLQDARDPNRLFLLGALLYMDGDHNSQKLLETAIALAGQQQHFLSFLAPRTVPVVHSEPAGKVPSSLPAAAEPAPREHIPQPPIPAVPPAPDRDLPGTQKPEGDAKPEPLPATPVPGAQSTPPMLPPLPM